MELAAVWPNFVNDILFRKSWMTMKNQQEIVGLFPTLHIACPERVGGSRTLSFSTTTGWNLFKTFVRAWVFLIKEKGKQYIYASGLPQLWDNKT
jgi:hypothetical protein